MRIRTIKPEFWKSSTVAQVSWGARLVLKALEAYVDDNGAGRFDLELIVTELFPRDYFRNPPGTLARVSEAISELLQAGLVWIYDTEDVSRGGREVKAVFISNWEAIQRVEKPNRGRIRRPDGTLEYRESEIREYSGSIPEVLARVPEVLAPVTEEQSNRGTEEQGNRYIANANALALRKSPHGDAQNAAHHDTPDDACAQPATPKPTAYSTTFETFWAAYPTKKDKRRAYKAWKAATKRATPETIITGAKAYAHWCNQNPTVSIKYPEGWLNGDRWEDDLTTRDGPTTKPDAIDLLNIAGQNLGAYP